MSDKASENPTHGELPGSDAARGNVDVAEARQMDLAVGGQRQAVPLLRAEAPYIGTGIEKRAAHDAADTLEHQRNEAGGGLVVSQQLRRAAVLMLRSGDHRPARVVVPSRDLHYGCLVEIDAIAALR